MKRSKLLQSSKDMLSRSFNPAKCKTSLRMAVSRLKLLRNKKEVQVKQMKKEVAQLLESGQEQTARIRVEHVIREEKMMAAYELLDIYCELIVARLPVIESQKSCPIDLKEAIASVIFASPRCGDVPELHDVKKQLAAKYGKDFTTAAIELRPQSGVGRMLIEKLSAAAPDVQTKTKILSAIAEEHNVKWEYVLLEEKVSSEINTLGKESKQYTEQPHFRAADSQTHPGELSNGSQLNHTPSLEPEKLNSAHTYGVSTTSQPKARTSGDDRPQLFQGDSYNSSLGEHTWTTEFKDATSAARAAAESAERASIAAKAAAELSSQHRSESHRSDAYVPKDERAETHSFPEFPHERKESTKKSSYELGGAHNKKVDQTDKGHRHNHGNREEYNQSASLKSRAPAIDNSVSYSAPVVDQYSQKNTTDEVHGVEISHEAETANDWTQRAENLPEEKPGKHHSVKSSRSHSSISDDGNIFANMDDRKVENDAAEYTSLDNIDAEESFQTSSYEPAAVFYDKFDSDTEDHGFDLGPTYDERKPDGFDLGPKYDEQNPDFSFSSVGQNSLGNLSINADHLSPKSKSTTAGNSTSHLFFTREDSFPNFPEKSESRDDPELDHFAPVTFDDSDGPTSDIDEELNTKHHMVDNSIDLVEFDGREQPRKLRYNNTIEQSVESHKGYSDLDRKQGSSSSDDELKPEEKDYDKNIYLNSPTTDLGSTDSRNESSNHIGEGLSFGKLRGGLRHKGRNTLPSLKNRSDISSSVWEEAESTNDITTESTNDITTRSTADVGRLNKGRNNLSSLKNQSDISSSIWKEAESTNDITTRSTAAVDRLNRGPNNLPSLKNRSDISSSIWKEAESTNITTESTNDIRTRSTAAVDRLNRSTMSYKKKTTQVLDSVMDSDSSEDEEPLQRKRETYTLKEKNRTRPMLVAAPNSFFGSDNSGSDEDHPKEPASVRSHLRSAVSRRTRASPSSAGTNSYSTTHLRPQAIDTDSSFDTKPMTSTNSESQRRNSAKQVNVEQPLSRRPFKSSFWETPEQHEPLKETSTLMQESDMELRSKARDTKVASKTITPELNSATTMQESKKLSTVEELSTPQRKTEVSSSNDTKRASHVHPKLPDYDTLLQSLRTNRS